MQVLSSVLMGTLSHIEVFGSDYDTIDGSGCRDYIHIMDIASAHLLALTYSSDLANFEIFNIGSEKGYTVFEIMEMLENITKKHIPFKVISSTIYIKDSWAKTGRYWCHYGGIF